MKLDGESASKVVKDAQLRCVNCDFYQGIEILEKMHVVGCLAVIGQKGRSYGTLNFEQVRSCPGPRKRTFDQLVAHHNTPPPDS